MKIVVLGGGLSTERNVSLVTSVSVCRALRSLGHKSIFVDLFMGLDNVPDNLEDLFDQEDGLCTNVLIDHNEPNIEEVKASRSYKSNSRIGRYVLDICKLSDCVFLGLHGEDGEDGKIQAVLEMFGIPYTGSNPAASAVAMDKALTRLVMQNNGIRCPMLTNRVPCVVKCSHGGSSIGTFICDTDNQFVNALEKIKKYNDAYIVEQKIYGMELTVPVLDGIALNPIEIVPPKNGKFDYVAKYQSGEEGATEICPARLSEEKTKEVQQIAEKLHRALNLSVYSRTDFIMDDKGDFWCLEVNTLPGLTPSSLIPKAARYAGIEYADLCEMIINLSMKKVGINDR